jgi:hypothetical protein
MLLAAAPLATHGVLANDLVGSTVDGLGGALSGLGGEGRSGDTSGPGGTIGDGISGLSGTIGSGLSGLGGGSEPSSGSAAPSGLSSVAPDGKPSEKQLVALARKLQILPRCRKHSCKEQAGPNDSGARLTSLQKRRLRSACQQVIRDAGRFSRNTVDLCAIVANL